MMVTVVARRLGAMVLTLVLSSIVIFAAMYAAPGDPVTFLIGNPENITPEKVAAVRAQRAVAAVMTSRAALIGNASAKVSMISTPWRKSDVGASALSISPGLCAGEVGRSG